MFKLTAFSLKIMWILLVCTPFTNSFAAATDSSHQKYNTYLEFLQREDLSAQVIHDTVGYFVDWDWKNLDQDKFDEINRILDSRIKHSASMAEKIHWHDLKRHQYQSRQNVGKAVVEYEKLIAINVVMQDTHATVANYHHLSWMYHYNGLYEEALTTYSIIPKIQESMDMNLTTASNYWTYGYFFSVAGWELQIPSYQDSAVKYIGKAYDYAVNQTEGVSMEWAITYAMALARNGDKHKAITVAKAGLENAEEIGDMLYAGRFHKQISNYYMALELEDSAYHHIYASSLCDDLFYPKDDPMVIPIPESGGRLHAYNVYFLLAMHDHFYHKEEAIELLDRILYGPNKIPDYATLMSYRSSGAEIYWNLGDYQKAAENFHSYVFYADSLNREQLKLTKEIKAAQLESQISLEKEKAQNEKEKLAAITKAEKANLRTIIYSAIVVAIIVAIFLIIVYRRFKVSNRQKKIIEEQKRISEMAYEQLDKKNQEVLDSINYAKRIQRAILPPQKVVDKYLPDSFIFYLPKDIVAGDFYWLESKKDQVLFGVGDCTGHGVPGAMVSVICNNGLNRCVREMGITNPGEILTKTREIVIKEFEKSEEDVMDGMDIAIVSLNQRHLKYAGAFNPLWILRSASKPAPQQYDNVTIEEELALYEVKADKQSIGKDYSSKPFSTKEFELQEGDVIYLMSDGYSDQFGGERGKKFKAAQLKKLLLLNQHLSMEEQKDLLLEVHEEWRGSLEQIDDICVAGLRIR